MREVLMISGCPHCGDGKPAVVTIMEMSHDEITRSNLVGDGWTEELIQAALTYPQVRIMSCMKVENDDRI